jgi:multisubunit Na+/H+ antiporter MnhG subunit
MWMLLGMDAFGLASCLAALGLYRLRERFLNLSTTSQIEYAGAVWIVHIAAFVAFATSL